MGKWTQGQLGSHDRVRERAADGHVHTVKWTQTPRDVKIQSMRKKNSFRERKNRAKTHKSATNTKTRRACGGTIRRAVGGWLTSVELGQRGPGGQGVSIRGAGG